MALPAGAASTFTYGSVKMNWNVPLTATLVLHSNYTAAGIFGGATNTLYATTSGCTNQTAETDLNLNFGNQAVSPTVPVSCLYKNALNMSLTTNAKYTVNEYLDTSTEVPLHTGFCAYGNGAALGTAGTAAVTQSARSADPGAATFAGGTITTCAGGGTYIPITTGTVSNSGVAPVAFPTTAGGAYSGEYIASGTGIAVITSPTPPSGVVYFGQDIQLDLDANAPATGAAVSAFMTVQLVSN
jgi:hypothetical protein